VFIFVSVYFVIDSVRKRLDTPLYTIENDEVVGDEQVRGRVIRRKEHNNNNNNNNLN